MQHMGITIRNSVFIQGNKPHQTIPVAQFLSRRHDPRPNCVFIAGDGLTQDLLGHHGISDQLPCTIRDLIPASSLIPYFPVAGDRFAEGEFWDSAKWPKITDFYEKNRESPNIFVALAQNADPINPGLNRGDWNFKTDSLGYELRCYLWHYFRSIHLKFDHHLSQEGLATRYLSWRWRDVFLWLMSGTSFSAITFNYDVFLERILPYSSAHTYASPVEQNLAPTGYPVNVIPIYKVHGSLSHCLYLPMMPGGGPQNPNPWLVEDLVGHFHCDRWKTEEVGTWNTTMPMVPDLVPPGFISDDICNPGSRASTFARESVAQADIIIVCGLSGNDPDTPEVTRLLAPIQETTHILSVGLSPEMKDTPVNRILGESKAESFTYFPAEQVNQIVKKLEELVPRTSAFYNRG